MKRVLVLSDSDSMRSQIVKGLLQYFARNRAEIYSAGIKAGKINPLAIKIMEEMGLDISGQSTNTLKDIPELDFDVIVTLSDTAKDQLPYIYSSALRVHRHLEYHPGSKAREEERMELLKSLYTEAYVFAHKFSKVHFRYEKW